jgi:hypothetical protein
MAWLRALATEAKSKDMALNSVVGLPLLLLLSLLLLLFLEGGEREEEEEEDEGKGVRAEGNERLTEVPKPVDRRLLLLEEAVGGLKREGDFCKLGLVLEEVESEEEEEEEVDEEFAG